MPYTFAFAQSDSPGVPHPTYGLCPVVHLQAKGQVAAVLDAGAHSNYSPGPGTGEGPVETPPLEEHPILVGKLTLMCMSVDAKFEG